MIFVIVVLKIKKYRVNLKIQALKNVKRIQ